MASDGTMGPPPSSFEAALHETVLPANLQLKFYSQDGEQDTRIKFTEAGLLHSSPILKHGEDSQASSNSSQPTIEANLRLRQKVWDELKNRLRKVKVSLDGLNQHLFSWLLPQSDAVERDWEAFLDNPLLVDTQTLKTMFNLEQSTADSSSDLSKNHLVYIRTFAYKVETLAEVLQALIDDKMPHDVLFTLLEHISGLDPKQVVFVRYAGQTTSGNAFSRHYKDLTHRGQTFMTHFLQATLRIAPQVIDAVEVHEFSDATVQNYSLYDLELADRREQALIAMFDRTSAINIQAGGKSRLYEPSSADEAQFIEFNTSLVKKFAAKCTPCSDEVLKAIRRYISEAQAYATNHPIGTGSDKYPIRDAVRDMLYNQAVPAMINDFALMVSIGSDIPPDAVQDALSFYGGGVAAGNICNTVFDQLASWEYSEYTKVKELSFQLVKEGKFPFVDLFPWSTKSDSDFTAAAGGLRSYLQCTSPVIVLTFGHKVASAAAGGFHNPNGMKTKKFAEAVGTLTLAKYDDDPADDDDDNCCISIPCYHPGTVAHNAPTSEVYLQIIGKTLTLVWLTMDVAVRLSGKGKMSKRKLCETIIGQVNTFAGPDTDFGETLTTLKTQLKDGLKKSCKSMFAKTKHQRVSATTRYQDLEAGRQAAARAGFSISYDGDDDDLSLLTSRNRWKKAKDELYSILAGELSAQKPQRGTQIKRITGTNHALFDDLESCEDLTEALKSVAANRLYYLELSDVSERLRDVPNLMSVHLDPKYNPNIDEWKSEDAAVQQADKNMTDWLTSNFIGRSDTQAKNVNKSLSVITKLLETKDNSLAKHFKAELRVLELSQPASEPFQGCQVVIKPSPNTTEAYSVLQFKWNEAGTEFELKNFGLPVGVLPFGADDKRYLYFVQGGLDIKDASGKTLGLLRDRTNTVSLQSIHTSIQDRKVRDAFLSLWERETGLKVEDQIFSGTSNTHSSTASTMVYPKSFFRTDGTPWVPTLRKKTKLLEELNDSKPIQPEDATWLLHKFLSQHYPNKGDVIDAGKPDVWPESDTVWPKFRTFLADPKYRNHPQVANLMSVVHGISDLQKHRIATTAIQPMIQFLRTDAVTKRYASMKGRAKERYKQLITITGVVPADLLDLSRPEPPLEPWSGNRGVDMEGLIEEEADDEEEEEEEMGGNSDDAEMLLQPEPAGTTWGRPTNKNISNIQHKPKDADDTAYMSDATHVSESTVGGGKRQRSSPGEQSKTKKGKERAEQSSDEAYTSDGFTSDE